MAEVAVSIVSFIQADLAAKQIAWRVGFIFIHWTCFDIFLHLHELAKDSSKVLRGIYYLGRAQRVKVAQSGLYTIYARTVLSGVF